MLLEAGLRAELPGRRRRERRRGRRPLVGRPAAGGRGRRERRHVPRAAAVGHDPHQRGDRPPRPLRLVRRHRRRLRPLPRPGAGARRWCAPTTRSPRSWRRSTAPSPTAPSASADFQAVDVEVAKGSQSFAVRRDGRAPRAGAPAAAGDPQRPQRHRRDGHGHGLRRRRSRVRAPGWPASAGWAAGSTSAASTGASPSSTTTPTSRRRSPPSSPRRRHGGDGWERVVAVFQPNRYSRMALLSPEYRDAFVDADLTVITDIYPSGEAPQPGVTGELVVDAVRAAHPGQEVVYVPRRTDLVELPGAPSSAPATCASRWGAATSPRCRRGAGPPHRARHGVGTGLDAGRGARATVRDRRRAADRARPRGGRARGAGPARRADRPAHHVPGRGPGRRCSWRPRRVDDLRPRPAPCAARGVPVLVVGRGSNLLVADRGFAGLVVTLGAVRHGHRAART